jgi:hypothetical protein
MPGGGSLPVPTPRSLQVPRGGSANLPTPGQLACRIAPGDILLGQPARTPRQYRPSLNRMRRKRYGAEDISRWKSPRKRQHLICYEKTIEKKSRI